MGPKCEKKYIENRHPFPKRKRKRNNGYIFVKCSMIIFVVVSSIDCPGKNRK